MAVVEDHHGCLFKGCTIHTHTHTNIHWTHLGRGAAESARSGEDIREIKQSEGRQLKTWMGGGGRGSRLRASLNEDMGLGGMASRQTKAIGERGSSDLLLLHAVPCTDHLDDLIMEGWMMEKSREKPRMTKMTRMRGVGELMGDDREDARMETREESGERRGERRAR